MYEALQAVPLTEPVRDALLSFLRQRHHGGRMLEGRGRRVARRVGRRAARRVGRRAARKAADWRVWAEEGTHALCQL